MSELIDGVDSPKENIISNDYIMEVLKNKCISKETLCYLKEIIGGRNAVDMSGYSGNSTIIIPSSSSDKCGYCIKFSDNIGQLKNEYVLLNLFNKYNLTPKCIDYIQDGMDVLVTEEICNPFALKKYKTVEELSSFMGRSLRDFHDINWLKKDFSLEETNILCNNGDKIIEQSLQHDKGLSFMADYQNDYNFDKMREYISLNYSCYKKDDVIIHGDFNPRNVFIGNSKEFGFVDVTDSGFGDRHYDIFWTMWTISLYLGIQGDLAKRIECEEIFLDAYGRDKIDEKRLELCKKITCMYWQENNNIKYFK